jgi:hypothetical protein
MTFIVMLLMVSSDATISPSLLFSPHAPCQGQLQNLPAHVRHFLCPDGKTYTSEEQFHCWENNEIFRREIPDNDILTQKGRVRTGRGPMGDGGA